MLGFTADLKLAARRLAATPLFTLFAVGSLAIGLALTTATYSVVDSVFLRDLGIRDPDRLLFVVTPYDGRLLKGSISAADFRELRAIQTSFADVSASAEVNLAVVMPFSTEVLPGEAVDGAYFATVGAAAFIGRTIQPADDERGAAVAVLSHTLWRSRFDADTGIVGKTIRISGTPFEVIGVAAPPFEGASGGVPGTRIWIPLGTDRSLGSNQRDNRRLLVFGRLTREATVRSSSAEVAAIAATLDVNLPSRVGRNGMGASERPWRTKSIAAIAKEDTVVRRVGLTLVALVVLVLVVACTNLANLVLARGTTRQQEITIRRALGASRWRLVREQCAEGVLIAFAGAVTAGVVFYGLRHLMNIELQVPLPMGGRWSQTIQPALDLSALGIAASALLISLGVFGLEPAWQLTRVRDMRGELAAGAAGAANPRARRQRTLLRWQVAISAGFFIIATMFVKYTIAEVQHDSGVAIDRLGIAVLNVEIQNWEPERVHRALERLVEESHKDPTIEAVSVSTGMPFGVPSRTRVSLRTPESPLPPASKPLEAVAISATSSIFRTIGVPIVHGRGFDERDQTAGAAVVVLSELAARSVFGAGNPVGRSLLVERRGLRPTMAMVIGVARDTDVGQLLAERRPLVYLPLSPPYGSVVTVSARSTVDAGLAVRALSLALRRTDPDLSLEVIGTGRAILAGPHELLRGAGVAALAVATVTLLVSMVGLFGIQSHIVGTRTREIGVRLAVGATATQIKVMVLKDGYRPVFEGLGIGLVIGLAGRAIVRSYLDADVQVVDPWMLLVVPVPVLLAACCACYLPARWAAMLEPHIALHHF